MSLSDSILRIKLFIVPKQENRQISSSSPSLFSLSFSHIDTGRRLFGPLVLPVLCARDGVLTKFSSSETIPTTNHTVYLMDSSLSLLLLSLTICITFFLCSFSSSVISSFSFSSFSFSSFSSSSTIVSQYELGKKPTLPVLSFPFHHSGTER
jgi:hypothetical protein